MPAEARDRSLLLPCLLLCVLAMGSAASLPADPRADPSADPVVERLGPAAKLEQALWEEPARIPNLYVTWANEVEDVGEGAKLLDYAVEVASLRAKRVFGQGFGETQPVRTRSKTPTSTCSWPCCSSTPHGSLPTSRFVGGWRRPGTPLPTTCRRSAPGCACWSAWRRGASTISRPSKPSLFRGGWSNVRRRIGGSTVRRSAHQRRRTGWRRSRRRSSPCRLSRRSGGGQAPGLGARHVAPPAPAGAGRPPAERAPAGHAAAIPLRPGDRPQRDVPAQPRRRLLAVAAGPADADRGAKTAGSTWCCGAMSSADARPTDSWVGPWSKGCRRTSTSAGGVPPGIAPSCRSTTARSSMPTARRGCRCTAWSRGSSSCWDADRLPVDRFAGDDGRRFVEAAHAAAEELAELRGRPRPLRPRAAAPGGRRSRPRRAARGTRRWRRHRPRLGADAPSPSATEASPRWWPMSTSAPSWWPARRTRSCRLSIHGLATDAQSVLVDGHDSPAARSLDRFLEVVAEHLRSEGLEVHRLPILWVDPMATRRGDRAELAPFLVGLEQRRARRAVSVRGLGASGRRIRLGPAVGR